MEITRRKFLKLGLMGTAGLALPLWTLQTARARASAAEAVVSPKVEPFAVTLPIPPVAMPVRSDAGADQRAPGDFAEGAADRDAVWQALAGLPRQQRAAVVLRFY